MTSCNGSVVFSDGAENAPASLWLRCGWLLAAPSLSAPAPDSQWERYAPDPDAAAKLTALWGGADSEDETNVVPLRRAA